MHGMEAAQSRPIENSAEGSGLDFATETDSWEGRGGKAEKEEEELKCTADQNKEDPQPIPVSDSGLEWKPKFHHPPKNILKPTIEVPMATLL